MKFTIRIAIDLDLNRLLQIGEMYFSEASRWQGLQFNRDKLMDNIMLALSSKDEQIFLAIGEEGQILGILWGCISGQVWSDNPVGHDRFLFVAPEHRGSGIAKALVSSFLQWCEACSCLVVQCGANSGIQGDAPAVNLYKSLGFGSGGRCFNLQLKGGN